jgi:hypothetical protein
MEKEGKDMEDVPWVVFVDTIRGTGKDHGSVETGPELGLARKVKERGGSNYDEGQPKGKNGS